MRVLADGRVRRSSEEWRVVLAKFEASGLSALAFCRQEQLSRSAFTRWRQELAAAPTPPGRFVELQEAVPVAIREVARGGFELVLPGGAVLRWRP